jgi:hypothetical protein
MATIAAMPSIIDDTNNNNRERFRLLSRHAIFNSQGKFKLFCLLIYISVFTHDSQLLIINSDWM